jgi:hypothetical protein
MNSKNSTIMHQCEAFQSSARPQVNQNAYQGKARNTSKFKKAKVTKK